MAFGVCQILIFTCTVETMLKVRRTPENLPPVTVGFLDLNKQLVFTFQFSSIIMVNRVHVISSSVQVFRNILLYVMTVKVFTYCHTPKPTTQ